MSLLSWSESPKPLENGEGSLSFSSSFICFFISDNEDISN